MADKPIYYARPYRGSQQHMVRESYDSESKQFKLTALCGLEPKKGWTYEYTGYGSYAHSWSEPLGGWPVCRACTARAAGPPDAAVTARLPYADDAVEELPI